MKYRKIKSHYRGNFSSSSSQCNNRYTNNRLQKYAMRGIHKKRSFNTEKFNQSQDSQAKMENCNSGLSIDLDTCMSIIDKCDKPIERARITDAFTITSKNTKEGRNFGKLFYF